MMSKSFTEIEILIRSRLAALEPLDVTVMDESHLHTGHGASGAHVVIIVVSDAFTGKPLRARHQQVYELLGELLHEDVHALSIKALAPDEQR